jgi:hypothetical protein
MTTDYKQRLAQELYEALKIIQSLVDKYKWCSINNCGDTMSLIDDVLQKYEEATTRGTGRTTILYHKAITEALENPCKSVEFIDHYPHTSCSAKSHGSNLATMITKLGYEIVVTVPTGGGRVFLYNRFGR